ncbi:MAG: hypothetical protein AAGA87_00170 [Pseudomonadota bacterium]
MGELADGLSVLRAIMWIAVGLFVAVGLIRGERDGYFYGSALAVVVYVAIAGVRFYQIQANASWIRTADWERQLLSRSEAWDFAPQAFTGLHLDWPIESNWRDIFLWADELPRLWELADPDNGNFLELGREQIYRATLLRGDVRCFSGAERVFHPREGMSHNRKARGICLLLEPVETSSAELRLTYDVWGRVGPVVSSRRSEQRLISKADGEIDRIVQSSTRARPTWFHPGMRAGKSRRLDDYRDGPIADLKAWLGAKDDAEEMTIALKQVELTDSLLKASIPRHGIFLACTQWDRVGPDLRRQISDRLDAGSAAYVSRMQRCGRTSCTPDVFGLGEPGPCTTPPPDTVVTAPNE